MSQVWTHLDPNCSLHIYELCRYEFRFDLLDFWIGYGAPYQALQLSNRVLVIGDFLRLGRFTNCTLLYSE